MAFSTESRIPRIAARRLLPLRRRVPAQDAAAKRALPAAQFFQALL